MFNGKKFVLSRDHSPKPDKGTQKNVRKNITSLWTMLWDLFYVLTTANKSGFEVHTPTYLVILIGLF